MAAMSQKRGKEKGEIGRQSRGVDRLTGDLESMVEEVVFVSRQMGFEGEVFRRSASQILERTRQLQRAATSDLQGDEAKVPFDFLFDFLFLFFKIESLSLIFLLLIFQNNVFFCFVVFCFFEIHNF